MSVSTYYSSVWIHGQTLPLKDVQLSGSVNYNVGFMDKGNGIDGEIESFLMMFLTN